MVDAGSKKRLDKLNLKAEDLFKEVNVMIKEYLKSSSDINLTLGNEQQKIEAIFNEVASKVKAVDSSMEGMVNAELQKNLKGLKNIEGRLIKAEKKKQEVSVNQITNLKDKLFPNSSLQERHDNLFSVLLFYGEDVIDELINQLNPLEKEFVILSAE